MNTEQIIILARKHLGGDMESSARICLQDAIECRDKCLYESARMWALRSLEYSVGIFHPDYDKASKYY
jgi:hypothetical protein